MEKSEIILLTLILLIVIGFVFYYFKSYNTLKEKETVIANLEKEKENLESNINLLQAEREDIKLLLKNVSKAKESELRNPAWNELKVFLELDDTNKIVYNESFDCTGFAVELFKRARDNGLRAGFVEVNYGDNVTGHILNVFQTVDKGMIFVDDTGNENGTGKDAIAYIEVEKPYGTIHLSGIKDRIILCDFSCIQLTKELTYTNYANVFDYNYFTKFAECRDLYGNCSDEYNSVVDSYNRGSKTYTYSQIQKWYDNLDVLGNQLISGEFYLFSQSSVVKNIEIYW